MDKRDLLRHKSLLLSKRQELSTGKSLADSIPAAGELRGDTADMANGAADAAMQIRLRQSRRQAPACHRRCLGPDSARGIRHLHGMRGADQQGSPGSGALDQVVQGLQGTAGPSKLRRWLGISPASPPTATLGSKDGYGGAAVFHEWDSARLSSFEASIRSEHTSTRPDATRGWNDAKVQN